MFMFINFFHRYVVKKDHFFFIDLKRTLKNTKLIHFYVPATAGKDTWSSGLHCGWHLQFNYTKYNKKTKTNKG